MFVEIVVRVQVLWSQINVLFWRLCIFYGLNELKPHAKNASNWGASACYTLILVEKRLIEPCLLMEVISVIKWWCSVSFHMHLISSKSYQVKLH